MPVVGVGSEYGVVRRSFLSNARGLMKQQGPATSDVPARLAFDALALLEAIPDRAAILDAQGVIRAVNRAWPAEAGAEQWIGSDYVERVAELAGVDDEAEREGIS